MKPLYVVTEVTTTLVLQNGQCALRKDEAALTASASQVPGQIHHHPLSNPPPCPRGAAAQVSFVSLTSLDPELPHPDLAAAVYVVSRATPVASRCAWQCSRVRHSLTQKPQVFLANSGNFP